MGTQLDLIDDGPPTTRQAETRKPRGFAAMDRDRVRAIASKGGVAAQAAGTAHRFTSEEARAAGKKGGTAPHVRRGRATSKSERIRIDDA